MNQTEVNVAVVLLRPQLRSEWRRGLQPASHLLRHPNCAPLQPIRPSELTNRGVRPHNTISSLVALYDDCNGDFSTVKRNGYADGGHREWGARGAGHLRPNLAIAKRERRIKSKPRIRRTMGVLRASQSSDIAGRQGQRKRVIHATYRTDNGVAHKPKPSWSEEKRVVSVMAIYQQI